MDLREKITEALRQNFSPDHILLDDEGGISGFVVSPQFRGVSSLERQRLIDKALRGFSVKLTKAELGRVLAIAALTPAEYAALDHK